jgi:glycosyltransferase involved in cell wall biosynthesis
MMVKDEEALLPQCLESIKEAVDEIIVVDTGSTDRTVEIAKSYGAKIYHHPWENNFSKHRNQSISYASQDWILIMDADEAFFYEDAPKLKRILRETHADFLYLQCYDLEKTGKVHGVFNQVRLFRNSLDMNYTSRVHNQLQTVGKGEYSKLRFRHFGYGLSPDKMEEKHKRTTSLLLQSIREDPENPYYHHQLAASYSMHREFEKAIEEGELALALMREKGLKSIYFVNVYYAVAQGCFALGDLDRAESVCREALDFFELDLNAYHFLAAICYMKKDLSACKEMSWKYLELHQMFEDYPEKMQDIYFNSYDKRHEIYYGMACIHFLEKDFEKAEEYFQRAFEDEGKPTEMAKKISLFYLEQSMEKNALKWLDTAYDVGCRDVILLEKLKAYYVDHGGLPGAFTKMKGLLDTYPSWGAVWTLIGDIQTELKDIPKAVESYEKSVTLDPTLKDTHMKLSSSYEQLGDIDKAITSSLKVSKLSEDDKSIHLRLAKLYILKQHLQEAAEYLERAGDEGLSEMEKHKKSLLGVTLCWLTGDVENLITNLEQVMAALDMNTNMMIDTAEELGHLIYEISERFCSMQQWQLAEMAFRIATQIAPEKFDVDRFTDLLSQANR